MNLFSKPIEAITSEDITALVNEGMPEGSQLEFKRELPANKSKDPWQTGANQIGDKARNEILEEIVAFANAHGGQLILGIEETAEKPSKAARVTPVSRCVELAEKFRLLARDCIEPMLPVFHSAGIVTGDNGDGVVVLRVPMSRLAPHRLIQTKECLIRRADRSEKMTMREIQDLTLRTERGLSKISARIDEFRERFSATAKSWQTGMCSVVGIRATLVPSGGELYVPRVHGNSQVQPVWEPLSARWGSGDPFELGFPRVNVSARPILRGTRYTGNKGNDWQIVREVHCDGTVEFELLASYSGEMRTPYLYPSWLVAIIANAILTAHKFRLAVGAPDAEYAVEAQIIFDSDGLPIAPVIQGSSIIYPLGELPAGGLVFPQMSVGPAEEFESLLTIMVFDLWHAAGQDYPDPFLVEFANAVRKIETVI